MLVYWKVLICVKQAGGRIRQILEHSNRIYLLVVWGMTSASPAKEKPFCRIYVLFRGSFKSAKDSGRHDVFDANARDTSNYRYMKISRALSYVHSLTIESLPNFSALTTDILLSTYLIWSLLMQRSRHRKNRRVCTSGIIGSQEIKSNHILLWRHRGQQVSFFICKARNTDAIAVQLKGSVALRTIEDHNWAEVGSTQRKG